ncbi:MAG: type I DNA topoisomerase [Gammaproteobacteria bacterium]|nr:type I DNA topoisomerase [Gammaproteobacteria bacterium]
MTKNLVIVESPAKAKTIEKYLGKDFTVMASYGHVRDLPAKKGSVKPEANFAMTYTLIERNSRHVDAIVKAIKQADTLYLATDPDREGEAISWHILSVLQDKGLIKNKAVHRIVFYEITKQAVKEAIEAPRDIAMHLVNAQQARRALDYLVGFNLSPLLWKKIRRGLSAGRVQSPALRLIVEREDEIDRFISQPYWYVIANCQQKSKFNARLTHWMQDKVEQFYWQNGEDAAAAREAILKRANGSLEVVNVTRKERLRHPSPPFITASLQQDASRKLGFTARKTMQIAQQLYEGIDIGSGTSGLITYMRTDSVNLAGEALSNIRHFITERYGKNFCPDTPRIFKTKSKNAQEAHEAIRPTDVMRTPEAMKSFLSPDQRKLYQLIWQRTMASQMSSARLDTVAVDLQSGVEDKFRANGSQIIFPGFLSVYEEGKDEQNDDDAETMLPELAVGDKIKLKDIIVEEHHTEPPARYSEASLVKALEEFDIGRPSTYASIISTLQDRDYVVVEKKRFIPTDVGRIVSHFLTEYFNTYVDYKFTAGLEDTLDAISRGEQEWIPVLENFWQPFSEKVQQIDDTVQRKDVTTEELNENCPKCDKPLAIRLGKRGRFIGCTAYPECDYTQDMGQNSTGTEPEVKTIDRACPTCSSALQIKRGKYGLFVGCSNYPECKFMEPLDKPEDTGVTCPICQSHPILKRKSKKGRIFYSCGGYPKCKYAIWNQPLNEPCPKCKWPILSLKVTKKFGEQKICPQSECGHTDNV